MRLDVKSETELQQRAQTGDVQAIAYWLNLYLLPQQQCARVSSLSPGYLDIQIRCHHSPNGTLLLQVLHARFSRLSLPHLRGAKVQISLTRPYPHVLEERFLIFQPTAPSPKAPASRSPSSGLAQRVNVPALKQQVRGVWASLKAQRLWQTLRRTIGEHAPSMKARPPVFTEKPQWSWLQRPPIFVGAAIATFLVGCGYEALTYYGTSPLRASSRFLPSVPIPLLSRSDRPLSAVVDTIQVHQQTVPVYSVPATSDSKIITLLFAPSEAYDDLDTASVPEADLALLMVDAPQTNLHHLPPANATIAHLSEHGIQRIGLGTAARLRNTLEWQGIYTTMSSQPSVSQPLVIETKDQRLAYLSYGLTNGEAPTVDAVKERLSSDIQALRSQVDWIIVNYDVGASLAAYPSDWQLEIARFAVDQGADVVVGYNPTLVQGAEYYQQGAIAYSLGRLEVPQTGTNALPSLPIGFEVRLRRDRPVQAELMPIFGAESTLPRSITLYLEQASGLFENPIPELEEPNAEVPQPPDRAVPDLEVTPLPPSETFTEPSSQAPDLQGFDPPASSPSSDSFVTSPTVRPD